MEINNVAVRLTAEPDELRTTPSGKQVVSFNVAYNWRTRTDAGFKDVETTFFRAPGRLRGGQQWPAAVAPPWAGRRESGCRPVPRALTARFCSEQAPGPAGEVLEENWRLPEKPGGELSPNGPKQRLLQARGPHQRQIRSPP